MLKECDDPYFSLNGTRFIQLKKDYIARLRDTVDLTIINRRRDATDEQKLNIERLLQTLFYIGCLENKSKVCHSNIEPYVRILTVMSHHNILKTDMRYLNKRGNFLQIPFIMSTPRLSVTIDQKDMSQPIKLFKRPFIIKVMGTRFNKPANI